MRYVFHPLQQYNQENSISLRIDSQCFLFFFLYLEPEKERKAFLQDLSSLNDEEEEFDGIEDTQRDTVSSRGYKRKRTPGAEAVLAEAMSVPEHLKK